MNFRLSHLFFLTAAVALVLFAIDRLTCRSVVMSLSYARSWDRAILRTEPELDPENPLGLLLRRGRLTVYRPEGTDYAFNFKFKLNDNQDAITGTAFGVFGYNEFLDADVRKSNVSKLDGLDFNIDYRYLSLPWAQRTDPHDGFREHFTEVMVYPSRQRLQNLTIMGPP